MEIIILVSTQCQNQYLHTLNIVLVHDMDSFTKGIFFHCSPDMWGPPWGLFQVTSTSHNLLAINDRTKHGSAPAITKVSFKNLVI